MRFVIALPLAFAVAVTLGACSNFDREDRIEDLRILGIRTEPAEILYSPLHLIPAATRPPLPLPTETVTIDTFAFDPRGGRIVTTIQLCPEGAGDSSCRLYDREQDLLQEPESARAELRALLEPQPFTSEVASDALPVGRIEPNEFQWSFTPTVIDFFIPDSADGTPIPSIFPLLPRAVVESTNEDVDASEVRRERAFKRIPVSLNLTDPALPPDVVDDLARGLGIELCSAPIPVDVYERQGRAECLEGRTGPNTNPDLAGFIVAGADEELIPGVLTREVTEENETPLTNNALGDAPVVAEPGAQLVINPVFENGVEEHYQVISFDIEASKIIILNRIEDLALSWYSTRGEMSSTLTAIQFGDELGVIWTLPQDVESGERDSIVLVAVDQRGGTSFGEITVEYP